MRVTVYGLWHLGCVTAACLAKAGHQVVAIDPEEATVAALRAGRPPLHEPGLADLVRNGLESGRLRFADDDGGAFADADVLWVTFDTPVDDDDVAQVSAVTTPLIARLPDLPNGCLVLVSSQVPVGTTRGLADAARAVGRNDLTFGYSPENLRLGKAIEVFTHPDRVVVGLQSDADRARAGELIAPFTSNILWVGIESAEMIKHAINAFLATSVTFMNEIASVAEMVGADAREVEAGLKSERRIGPGAYLSPGSAFAGGTLARDVTTLAGLAHRHHVPAALVPAILESNRRHGHWALRKLKEQFGSLAGQRIAILGLTYKPGTSTLRRSGAVELGRLLHGEGAKVTAFDPALAELPPELVRVIELVPSAEAAVAGAVAVVLATPWPEFRGLDWPRLLASMSQPAVVDAGWFLAGILRNRADVAYSAVGLPRLRDTS
ncbi:UDP-glucose/GDP-mannose dehydrogenase family protein [soil metagenome]